MQSIQAVRGFNDILPSQVFYWQHIERCVRKVAKQYAYQEIRFPILEKTELFTRSVGEVTDIVEKEMYTFQDRNGDSLTLRPEGTACCVRAALEQGLLHNQIQRLWYQGPMFRHERPQAGRYRQFYQVGFEAFGIADPYLDAELILLTARLWRELGLLDQLKLQLNTLGTLSERQIYREALVKYFSLHESELDADSQRRLHTNPLRILDTKNLSMSNVVEHAPKLMDYLAPSSLAYFECIKSLLEDNGIAYEVAPRLVRGLDYYTHAVFEWTTDQLGAQATVCAGGRYDTLVEQLGGKSTPAVGCAMGLERLVLLLEKNKQLHQPVLPWIYILSSGEQAKMKALKMAEQLRDTFPFEIINDTSTASFKSQMKRADKSEASLALIIGEDELKTDTIGVKFLREALPQQAIKAEDLIEFLKHWNETYGTRR